MVITDAKQDIPDFYRKTDPKRLPDYNAFEVVSQWKWGPVGLYCYGPSGSGKSRSIYRLLEATDIEAVVVTGNEFQQECVERNRPGGIGGWEDWLSDLRHLSILYFDDVSKLRFSERCESEFHSLLDYRITHEYPTFFTSELSIDDFGERISDDNRAGIMRRIKEFCQPVRFGEGGTYAEHEDYIARCAAQVERERIEDEAREAKAVLALDEF